VRDRVSQADLRVECAHGVGKWAASGHDQDRPVAGELQHLGTASSQSIQTLGA